MYYINRTKTDNGNYGNPQTVPFGGCLNLPDEMLDAYITTMGFATILTVGDDVVSVEIDQEAYDAYQNANKPTAEQQREQAYESSAIISYRGQMITVDQANKLWTEYTAEGDTETSSTLQTLIAEAKESIREEYPDEV